MAETRRKFDADFREGAVRLVRETGKPIAQVARDLGINAGTLGNWVNADRRRHGDGSGALDEAPRRFGQTGGKFVEAPTLSPGASILSDGCRSHAAMLASMFRDLDVSG